MVTEEELMGHIVRNCSYITETIVRSNTGAFMKILEEFAPNVALMEIRGKLTGQAKRPLDALPMGTVGYAVASGGYVWYLDSGTRDRDADAIVSWYRSKMLRESGSRSPRTKAPARKSTTPRRR